MKRVLVDQGSVVEVMYPDLYRGLNLKPEDLTAYDSPLVSFEGKTVTPRGQIRQPVQTSSDVVEVDFIVVDAYSPYTTIMARPWLHTLGVLFYTSPEGEIPVERPGRRDCGESDHGQTVHGGCHLMPTQCWALGLH